MKGRMLSRAIQRTSPTMTAAAISTATRGESGTNRLSPGSAAGLTKGGGGSDSARSVVEPSLAIRDRLGGLVHRGPD